MGPDTLIWSVVELSKTIDLAGFCAFGPAPGTEGAGHSSWCAGGAGEGGFNFSGRSGRNDETGWANKSRLRRKSFFLRRL